MGGKEVPYFISFYVSLKTLSLVKQRLGNKVKSKSWVNSKSADERSPCEGFSNSLHQDTSLSEIKLLGYKGR